jgi:hypothetical protein
LRANPERVTIQSKQNPQGVPNEPNGPQQAEPVTAPLDSPPDPEDAAKHKFSKAFMENYEKAEHVRLFPRPGKKVGINMDAAMVLRHYQAVRLMNEQNTYLSVKSNQAGKATLNYLDQTFQVGATYTMESIRGKFAITQNTHHTGLCNQQMPFPDAMIPERWYKNDFEGFRKVVVETTKDPEYVYSQRAGSLQTWLGPKGGNPTCGGTHGQAAVSDPNKEVCLRTETAQNLSSNLGLLENDMANAVFHLFVPADWSVEEPSMVEALKEKDKSNRDGKVVYLLEDTPSSSAYRIGVLR